MIRSRILVLAVLCVLTNMLHAQTPDTQPRDERVVYDTLFVHDTLHVRDTINIGEYIRSQTFEQLFSGSEYTDIQSLPDSLKTKFEEAVTFSEKLVLNNRDQNDLSMDSIKKIISAGLIVLGMSGVTPAQTDSTGFYKFSAGLCLNTFGGGPSIKYGISKNCVFQTDFSGRLFINKYSPENSFILYVYELSQNFLYQRQFAEKNGVLYYYLVGAGVSGGVSILRPTLWKLGAYPLFGMEFVLKKPKLSFQIDLRAGYCSLLKSANAKPPRTSLDNNPLWLFCYTGMPKEYPYHGSDVSLNFAVRFCKIK